VNQGVAVTTDDVTQRAVFDVMRTTGSTRSFSDVHVPDDVIDAAIEAARFAPSGGNRQPVRWIVVRDATIKASLADLYLPLWQRDMAMFLGGTMRLGMDDVGPAIAAANHFAEHIGEASAILVGCVVRKDLHAHMEGPDGPNMLAGSSVYPTVQNLCLALRAQGVGSTLTTLICEREYEAAAILGIPEGVVSACHVVVGYPAKPFPTSLSRLSVQQLRCTDRYSFSGAPS